MRISDWSSDVCSSDLGLVHAVVDDLGGEMVERAFVGAADIHARAPANGFEPLQHLDLRSVVAFGGGVRGVEQIVTHRMAIGGRKGRRSEEHTSELQSLMRISYAVF